MRSKFQLFPMLDYKKTIIKGLEEDYSKYQRITI